MYRLTVRLGEDTSLLTSAGSDEVELVNEEHQGIVTNDIGFALNSADIATFASKLH